MYVYESDVKKEPPFLKFIAFSETENAFFFSFQNASIRGINLCT